jgi:hypothetical protein
MRRLLFLLLVLASPALAAQTVIHHCVAGNGTPVFTDQACGNMDATLVFSTTEGGQPTAVVPVHSPTNGVCPASAAALKARVASAFDLRDSNALAGLMLWRGYGQHAAKAGLRRLRALVRQPLLGFGEQVVDDAAVAEVTDIDGAGLADAQVGGAADGAPTLTVYLGSIGSRRQASFGIVPRAGCVWLRP